MCPLIPCLLGAWCAGWCGSRLCRSGTHDSRGPEWTAASMEEAQEILHYARLNMGAYAATPEQAVSDAGGVLEVSAVQKLDEGREECPAHVSCALSCSGLRTSRCQPSQGCGQDGFVWLA